MAPSIGGRVLPSEVVSNILGRLDAAGVARGESVSARWRKAGRCVKSLRFTDETFPEGMAPEKVLTIMTRMIMQATDLEHLDITYLSTAGLPDSLLTAWFLALRPTLVSLKSTSLYSFEQMLQGVRHPSLARHVSAHFQRAPLRHLSLAGCELPADAPSLPLLESLELSDVSTTSAALTGFVAGCGRLVKLTLADLDGLNRIDVRSASLRQVSVGAEMNSVSFTLSLNCPNLQTLSVKSTRLNSGCFGRAPAIESVALENVSGGPIRFQGLGSGLRSVVLRAVTWQHVGAVMSAAQGRDVRVLEIDEVTGSDDGDVWMEEDDSEQDTDSHQASPRSAPLRTPVDLDLLSDTEEAFDVQSRPKLAPPTSTARSLPAFIASFENLKTLGLDAGVWELCCQMGFQSVLRTSDQRQPKGGPKAAKAGVAFTKLTEFEVKGATVGRSVVHSIEKMVGMCPVLQKLVLCGELGRTKPQTVPPPFVRLSSSASRTSIDSEPPAGDDFNSAELLEDSSTNFHKRHLAHFPHAAENATRGSDALMTSEGLGVSASGEDSQGEFDPVAFSTKFAAQAMALQRKYPRILVDVQFRNSDQIDEE